MKKIQLCALVSLSVCAGSAFAQQEPVPTRAGDEPIPEQAEDEAIAPAQATAGKGVKSPASSSVKNEFASLMGRPGGLTSDEAARQAAAHSRDALVAREQVKVADSATDQIIYNYLPRLTLTAQYKRQTVPGSAGGGGFGNLVGTTEPAGPVPAGSPLFAIDSSAFDFSPLPNSYYLNAGLVVPLSDYLLNLTQALKGASASKKSSQLNERAARLSAAANARLAYYEWVRARLRMAEAKRSLERTQAQLTNLEKLKEAGRVARADVLQQDAFVASAELGLRRAETQEAVARETLHVSMTGGKGPTPSWTIGENVMEDLSQSPLRTTEELHREAMGQRLEIQALENTAYAFEQQSSVRKAHALPRLEAFGNLTYANPNPIYVPPQNEWNGSWDVGIRMVWTLNDYGASRAEARSSDAEAAKVRAQKSQLMDALRTEVLTSRQMLEEARLAKETAIRGVKAAEASHEARSLLLNNGRATSLDVLQSETALVSARLNLVDAHIALRQAEVRLRHAVGRDVQGSEKSSKPKR